MTTTTTNERDLINRMGLRLYRAAITAPYATTKTARLDIVRGCRGHKRLTLAEACDAVADAQALRATRRNARNLRRGKRGNLGDKLARPLSERWDAHMRDRMYSALRDALGYYPAHGDLYVELHDSPEVTTRYEREDCGRYSSRCTYHIIAHHGTIVLPRHGVTLSTADGVTMILRYREAQTHGGVTATPGAILSRRGYDLRAREAWMVCDGELYAHGETRHAAMRALAAKRAALRRKAAPITLDTVITPAMYQRITGACTEGTNEWLAEHGLTRSARGTVRELLEMLDDSDYGKRRLAQIVAI